MVKIIIVALLIVNVIACEPVQQAASREKTPQFSFNCITSQSECEIDTNFGTFFVQFSGQTVEGKLQTELPFNIQLSLASNSKKTQLVKIDSYLEGKEMFMGKIPIFFNTDKHNVAIAESLLANCAEEVMVWRLWFKIELSVAGETQQQNFFIDFDSQRL